MLRREKLKKTEITVDTEKQGIVGTQYTVWSLAELPIVKLSQDDVSKQTSTTRLFQPPQSLRLDLSIDTCVLVFQTHGLIVDTIMFSLFCYVRGDHYKQAFPVKIEEDEDIAALKKAIKEEKSKTFHEFEADSLVLWKTSVTYNTNLKENVERLDLDYDKSLEPLDHLLDIFSSDMEKKSVHIVIDHPPPGEFSYAICVIKSSRLQQQFRRFHPNHGSSNWIAWCLEKTIVSSFLLKFRLRRPSVPSRKPSRTKRSMHLSMSTPTSSFSGRSLT